MRQSTSTAVAPWPRTASPNMDKPTLTTCTWSGSLSRRGRMLDSSVVMEVTARWEGGYRCTMRIRQFQLRVDEPPASGGTDTGMQPTELLLASVASCFNLAIAHVAMNTGAALAEMSVTATGDYEGPRFRRIIVRVDSAH